MVRVLVGLLAALSACVPGATSGRKPLSQYAGARPGSNPGFNPTTDAHNPNVTRPGPRDDPVFVIPWQQGGTQTEQEREAERQRYIAEYRTHWMSDPSRFREHHLFPRARTLRPLFEAMGIKVDRFTILVDEGKHREAHGGQELYGAGGRWNWEWRQWFTEQGASADHIGAWKKAFEMVDKFGLSPHGPLCPYRCGREIVHDQFDVEGPEPEGSR